MQEEWITHMAKPDLLARIRKDRAEIAALWQNLTEAQLTRRPGPQSDWSIKDLVAHLSFWEQLMIETISRLKQGLEPQDLGTNELVDNLNAEVFKRNEHRPLAEVLAEFDSQRAQVEATLEALTDDEINQADYFAQQENTPLLYHIIGNTFGHYADHKPDLERYLASLS